LSTISTARAKESNGPDSPRRRHEVEAGEAPGAAFRIGGLIISIEACCDILGVADAGERQFFDHETCDELRFLRNLKGCFLCEQFFLPDEKREKLDLLAIERVVYIA